MRLDDPEGVVDKSEAEKLRGTVPALLSDARAWHEAAGSPGSLGKDLRRAVRAATLGYLAEMAGLAMWVLGKKRPARGRFRVNFVEDLLMRLALWGLCVADVRLEVDRLVTASDASEAAGAVVYSAALTGRGCALAARRQRPADAAAEEETALITVFDGIGGGRRAFEILGLAPAVHLSFEVGRITHALVIGDFPCHVCASLNVDRRGSSDPRVSLVDCMVELIGGLRAAMPEATVDFLCQNVASMAESDVIHLNRLFERVHLEIEAGGVGWVKRPRLYWASWDLLPSYEAEAIMVVAKDSSARRACRVALKAARPPLEERLPAGASCPGAAEGEPLPTFVRWTLRSQPRPRPAGIGECSAAELARWEEAGFAAPPYQFRDKWCTHWPDGQITPPDAGAREKLMGFAEGHTAPCMTSSEAKADPGKYEALRRSLLG
ncbi:unnamed protein product, partial [Prorocentrum cordatum]